MLAPARWPDPAAPRSDPRARASTTLAGHPLPAAPAPLRCSGPAAALPVCPAARAAPRTPRLPRFSLRARSSSTALRTWRFRAARAMNPPAHRWDSSQNGCGMAMVKATMMMPCLYTAIYCCYMSYMGPCQLHVPHGAYMYQTGPLSGHGPV